MARCVLEINMIKLSIKKSFFGVLFVFVMFFVLLNYVQRPQDLRNRAEGCGVFDGDPCCPGMKCDINMNCDKTTVKCVKCGGDYQPCCLSTDRNTCRPGLECDRGVCKKKVEDVGNGCFLLKGSVYIGPNTNGGDYNCDGVVDIADYSVWRKEFVDRQKWVEGSNWWADVDGIGNVKTTGYSTWRNVFFK
jgi:hypothetical protein